MSIIETYLGVVARWRWSFLLALLIGTFVLQALLPQTPFIRLIGFTLFLLIFGGAIYAGRTSPWAMRGAVALLLAALVLQVLDVLGVATLEGAARGSGLADRPRRACRRPSRSLWPVARRRLTVWSAPSSAFS